MSIKIMSWVFESSPYDGVSRLIHLALADHANDQGVCWPGAARIAAMASCKPDYVRQVIRRMIDDGHAQVLEQGGGRGNRNVLQLLGPWSDGHDLLPDTPPPSGGKPPRRETGETPQTRAQTPQTSESAPLSRTINEPNPLKPPRHDGATVGDFGRFWLAYPRKAAKDAALRAWTRRARAHSLPPIAEVLEAIERYRQTDEYRRGFIVYPATWLNQGRWADETSTPSGATVPASPKCATCGVLNPNPALCLEGAACTMRKAQDG